MDSIKIDYKKVFKNKSNIILTIMMKTIDLPSYGDLHFGAMSDLKIFENCYFEDTNPESNFIYKAINYNPDEIYSKTDGNGGNCWTAYVEDYRMTDGTTSFIFNFRNFGDLVVHYEKEGLKFVNTKIINK